MSAMQDTGVIAHVDETLRRDLDEGPASNALEGGADNDLDDIYADPGEIVEDELG